MQDPKIQDEREGTPKFFCLFIFVFVFVSETGSHFVALVSLELSMQTRLALDSRPFLRL